MADTFTALVLDEADRKVTASIRQLDEANIELNAQHRRKRFRTTEAQRQREARSSLCLCVSVV